VGYPIVDDTGAVVGAVYAGINLTWLNTAIDQWNLGAQTAIYVTDRNGIQIARQPNSRGVGHPIAADLKPFLSAKESGAVEVTDPSGAVNLFGYIPVGVGPSDGIAVFVGRDKRQITSDINQSIWLNVAAVLAGLLLSVILALVYLRRFLTRPFQNLLTVAGR
jgi:sensor histidine kinase regulating citrate/malate metabolism